MKITPEEFKAMRGEEELASMGMRRREIDGEIRELRGRIEILRGERRDLSHQITQIHMDHYHAKIRKGF